MTLVNVYDKGKAKVVENFEHKLFMNYHVTPSNTDSDDEADENT